MKCNFGTWFFARCWWSREPVPWGSSMLSDFRTSLSKVLTLWHFVKVKQCYLCVSCIAKNSIQYYMVIKNSWPYLHQSYMHVESENGIFYTASLRIVHKSVTRKGSTTIMVIDTIEVTLTLQWSWKPKIVRLDAKDDNNWGHSNQGPTIPRQSKQSSGDLK